jgi:hypothetical protein
MAMFAWKIRPLFNLIRAIWVNVITHSSLFLTTFFNMCTSACDVLHVNNRYYGYFISCLLGKDVVIVKNGRRICGSGAALANAPILQNKAYFEAKVQSSGRL